MLFIQSAVEDLPAELNGVADEVHVHFPWRRAITYLIATADDAEKNPDLNPCNPWLKTLFVC